VVFAASRCDDRGLIIGCCDLEQLDDAYTNNWMMRGQHLDDDACVCEYCIICDVYANYWMMRF
jgi:hypothetical protein